MCRSSTASKPTSPCKMIVTLESEGRARSSGASGKPTATVARPASSRGRGRPVGSSTLSAACARCLGAPAGGGRGTDGGRAGGCHLGGGYAARAPELRRREAPPCGASAVPAAWPPVRRVMRGRSCSDSTTPWLPPQRGVRSACSCSCSDPDRARAPAFGLSTSTSRITGAWALVVEREGLPATEGESGGREDRHPGRAALGLGPAGLGAVPAAGQGDVGSCGRPRQRATKSTPIARSVSSA